jgi:hypothetical protein
VLLAVKLSKAAVTAPVEEDPFVKHQVAEPEIISVAPSRMTEGAASLLAKIWDFRGSLFASRLLRYSSVVRKILVIFLILLGSVFLTQTVSASVSSYEHCCITECGDMDACAVPGCQPCGLHLMASTLFRSSDSPQSTGMPDGSVKGWASWRTSVWRPPD